MPLGFSLLALFFLFSDFLTLAKLFVCKLQHRTKTKKPNQNNFFNQIQPFYKIIISIITLIQKVIK